MISNLALTPVITVQNVQYDPGVNTNFEITQCICKVTTLALLRNYSLTEQLLG
jgi:hypothetical protein